MLPQKNIEKYLNHLKLFNYSIKLEYDKLRGKNHKILILNPGFILNTDNNFEILIKTILECTKLDYFRCIEFIDVLVHQLQKKKHACMVTGYTRP